MANRYWDTLFSTFARYQLVLLEGGTVIATGQTIPLVWNGRPEDLPSGWDGAVEQGVADDAARRQPNTLCALAAIVDASHQGRGLSRLVLEAMKKIASESGLTALIAPVRPTLKSSYPLTPLKRYAKWTQPNGLAFDPWLRVHWRMGATILGIAPRSMIITGTVAEWEEWTGLHFPESGAYVVPGALQPITINRDANLGRYEEANVWMLHRIARG